MGRLDKLDLSLKLSKEEEAERLAAGWKRLEALRLALGAKLPGYGLGPPVCVLFEGWDASGKGGAIKRLVAPLDMRHVRVSQFAAPTPDEKRHHYLWRFWPQLPGWGGMAVFDRSWYGRVLVERVEGFATEEQWRRAYGEIVELERTLHSLKSWKLTPDDWENRRKRPQYAEAIEEMLKRTEHEAAPWELVEAESKKYARVKVVETVIERVEAGMRAQGIEPPPSG